MARVVADILGQIEDAAEAIAQSGFGVGAGVVGDVITAGATLLIAFLGINVMLQVKPMSTASFIYIAVRLLVISIFAQSWDNFSVILKVITDVPDAIGGRIVSLAGVDGQDGIVSALDQLITKFMAYGDSIGENAGYLFGAVMGALFFVIGCVFVAIAVAMIASGAVGVTAMVGLAPFAITASMFPVTAKLFDGWLRQLIGFALFPLVTGAMLGAVFAVGIRIANGSASPDAVASMGDMVSFVVVFLLSSFMLLTVPGIASALSGGMALAGEQAGRKVLETGKALPGKVPGAVASAVRSPEVIMGQVKDGLAAAKIGLQSRSPVLMGAAFSQLRRERSFSERRSATELTVKGAGK